MTPLPRLGADDFLSALLALLPPGEASPASAQDEPATQIAFWQAVAEEFGRLHKRVSDLTETEADPAQTCDLLENWEDDYGLPDTCTPTDPTLAQRHAALLTKIRAQGEPLISYFEAVAASLGYSTVITVTAANQWTFTTPATTINYFRVGESSAGEPLRWTDSSSLECRMRRICPAWIELLFSYTT